MHDGAKTAPPTQGAQIPDEVHDLAEKVAVAADNDREARTAAKLAKSQFAEAKANLHSAMVERGLASVPLSDRKPITITAYNESRKPTKGALQGLVGKDGFDWLTAERVEQLWQALPSARRTRLNIPAPPDQPLTDG